MPGSLLPPPTPPSGQLPPGPPSFQPPVRYRRGSIFSGLLLIIVGTLLLVARLHSNLSLGYVITHFWPVIIIVWGLSRLIDRYALPHGSAPGGMVTAGEIALIVGLIAIVGFFAAVGSIAYWLRDARFNGNEFGVFNQRYSETKRIDMKQLVAPNSVFTVNTQNGTINVHAGNDKSLLAVGTASAPGTSEQAALNRMKNLDLSFDGNPGNYQIHPINANGGGISVDLDVQLPKTASVTARSQRGDVTVIGFNGATDVATRTGNIQIHDVGSNVIADVQNGDTHIGNVAGSVNFTGRGGGDVEITDVQRDVTVGGNIFGEVDVRNAAKGVHYSSPRASAQIAALPGEFKIDNSDIALSHASGPIVINAHNQDMRLDNVSGQLNLSEIHGDINITFASPPKAPITIDNDSGDVILVLPPQSSFTISAQSNSGDIDDDFGGTHNNPTGGGHATFEATYGSGGPLIHITTKYGTIHIAKTQ